MITFRRSHAFVDAVRAKTLLDSLSVYYPEFEYWYVNQCMPGIVTGNDVLVVAEAHHQLIGVGLGKARDGETKLRCIRVAPPYQSRGIGLRLVDRMLRELDHDKPHCTVCEEMFHSYSAPFINRYGFDLSQVSKHLYRRGKLEYVFNQANSHHD
ncbi:GNAT family N-acetyltransferase [Paraburkholderia sp. BCC1886]|uniref:GNAT family N-acetyltransferase n=1 Tax=Paraburkholderia sp. BCC1886 TaxID=2562670 RepID=UPI001181EF3D|nr:GNAT family N-acetyltransferase [Paraburkholderia sp. BCC1886]